MEMNVEKTKVMKISRHPSPVQIMVDKKQVGILEYFNYFGSMIRNDAKFAREIKSRTAIAKTQFNKNKILFTSNLDINLRKKIV
jgi:hypothetical protein